MKFILLLSLVALCSAAFVVSEDPDDAIHTDTAALPELVPHPQLRAKRGTCNAGEFACNLHCQWKGYAKGTCGGNVCRCSGYSG